MRAVLDRDAEIGDLNRPSSASVRTIFVRGSASPRSIAAQKSPVPCGDRQRLQIEAVRLDLVGRDVEPARACRGRAAASSNCDFSSARTRGIRSVERQLLHVLGDGPEVARVERQLRAAARFPHAVAVAETRERALVPVLDEADPRIAERLAVVAVNAGIEPERPGARRRLAIEAGVLDAVRGGPCRDWLRSRVTTSAPACPCAESVMSVAVSARAKLAASACSVNADGVVADGVHSRLAVRARHEEHLRQLDRGRLRRRRQRGPVRARHPRVHRQLQPTRRAAAPRRSRARPSRRCGGNRLRSHVGRQAEGHRVTPGGRLARQRNLGVEPLQAFGIGRREPRALGGRRTPAARRRAARSAPPRAPGRPPRRTRWLKRQRELTPACRSGCPGAPSAPTSAGRSAS